MTNDQALQAAVLILIKKFVRRQTLVLRTMRVVRPDLVIRERDKRIPEGFAELVKLYSRRSQLGLWGKDQEWEYFIHGKGCRLTHTITKERLEWDCGSLCTFDRYWFVHYLEWALQQPNPTDAVLTIQAWIARSTTFPNTQALIFSVLEELSGLGVLSKLDTSMRYTLLIR